MSVEAENGSSDPDIKKRFFGQFKQEETSLQEQMIRLKGTALEPAERASIVDQCLASISKLSSELKDASAYLPAYDQRIYSTTVKSLNESLQEIRNASAPKRKFAFRKTFTQKSLSESGNGHSEDASVQSLAATSHGAKTVSPDEPKESYSGLDDGLFSEAAGATTITSVSSTHHKLDSASLKPGPSISITKIHHSVVDLSDSLSRPFATLAINSVTESLVICGRTSGAAHITGVQNSTLVVWSRQLRMHECNDCLVYLRCGSRPIIEDCRGIRFTPFPSVYDTTELPQPEFPNLWDRVDDFKWLRAEHSPNWSTLQPGDEGTIKSGAWECIKSSSSAGCTVLKIDDLLRAAKVT